MACYVMHPIQQRAQQRADLANCKSTIVGPGLVQLVGMAPFPIRRKNSCQPRRVETAMREACRRCVGKPLGDIEPDILGIPSVGKADIEQMRGQRELENDARLIEHFVTTNVKSPIQRFKKGFGIMVTEAAQAPPFLGPDERSRFIVIAVVKERQRLLPRSRDRGSQSRSGRYGEDRQQGAARRASLKRRIMGRQIG